MFKTFPQNLAMTLDHVEGKKEDSVGAKDVCKLVLDGTICKTFKHKMMFILC